MNIIEGKYLSVSVIFIILAYLVSLSQHSMIFLEKLCHVSATFSLLYVTVFKECVICFPLNGFHVVVSHCPRLLKVLLHLGLGNEPGLDLPSLYFVDFSN